MITRVMPVRWPATGRWQVRQYLAPYGGPMGTPQVRYAVIGPHGLELHAGKGHAAALKFGKCLASGLEGVDHRPREGAAEALDALPAVGAGVDDQRRVGGRQFAHVVEGVEAELGDDTNVDSGGTGELLHRPPDESNQRSPSSNNLKIRLYSSAQLVGSTKPWFSTG